MSAVAPPRLLHDDEPPPVELLRSGATAGILLVCDHAGRRVPRALGDLGILQAELERHIGWDIGAAGVTRALSNTLKAPAILQLYSRLVIDCNRRPGHPASITPVSDGTAIPGNAATPPAWRAEREREIFEPYHRAIAQHLDREISSGAQPTVVAVHSFTPVMAGNARIWQAGVLFNRNPDLALALAKLLRGEGLIVGENEPYALSDEDDYTIPVHAERRGLPYVELEIRQDLIAGVEGQLHWSSMLARLLPCAMAAL